MTTRTKHQQRGVAVIMALLIMTLAASTATYVVWQQSLWVRQLENISDRAKADQLAAGAIDFARDALKQDKKTDVDSLDEAWAQPVTLPADNATVTGQVTDEQGRFNLNSLAGSNSTQGAPPGASQGPRKVFEQLLTNLDIKNAPELAAAVADWMDASNNNNNTADLYYLSRNPPYRAGQQPLADASELIRIQGFDEDIVRKLSPYVTALKDSNTPINVNTASEEVLAAIFNPALAKSIVRKPSDAPFKSISEVQAQLGTNPNISCAAGSCYDVKSSYYSVHVKVQSGLVEANYTALLHRDPSSQTWPAILTRKDAAD